MVFGPVTVDVAACLMEPESRENWEMCQGLDSSSQRHNDLTKTLWLCQVENEAFNGWLLPLPWHSRVKHTGTRLVLSLVGCSSCLERGLELGKAACMWALPRLRTSACSL